MPAEAGWSLVWTRPSDIASSSGLQPLYGEPFVVAATASIERTAPLAASATAGMVVAVAVDPPEVGPCGSELSPRTTSILSIGMPVLSLTTWAKTVYVPVPMSCVAQLARAVPSSLSCTLASQGPRQAPQEAAAIPQPRITS